LIIRMIASDNPDLGGDAERHFLDKMEKIAKLKYAMGPPQSRAQQELKQHTFQRNTHREPTEIPEIPAEMLHEYALPFMLPFTPPQSKASSEIPLDMLGGYALPSWLRFTPTESTESSEIPPELLGEYALPFPLPPTPPHPRSAASSEVPPGMLGEFFLRLPLTDTTYSTPYTVQSDHRQGLSHAKSLYTTPTLAVDSCTRADSLQEQFVPIAPAPPWPLHHPGAILAPSRSSDAITEAKGQEQASTPDTNGPTYPCSFPGRCEMIFETEHLRTMHCLAVHPGWVLRLFPRASSTAAAPISSTALLTAASPVPLTTYTLRS
jgi:hypothetical protein